MTENANARRVLFTLPLGASLETELQVKHSPAIAHIALSQLKPTHGWAESAAFDNERFAAESGYIRHYFKPNLQGFYMFDWQFYLSQQTYEVYVSLSVAGSEQYSRAIVAGAIPNLNPRGVIGISVV